MIIEGKEIEIKLNDKVFHCALDVTWNYIGGKWKSVVLWYLRKADKRFRDFKKLMPDITEKTLSVQLRQLEKSGLIGKRIFAQVPPKVEYYLTEEGKTLLPALEELAAWGRYKASKEGAFEEVNRKKTVKKKV